MCIRDRRLTASRSPAPSAIGWPSCEGGWRQPQAPSSGRGASPRSWPSVQEHSTLHGAYLGRSSRTGSRCGEAAR
eukprot:8793119-Pyramimonas_sp.AAC.1